MDPKSRRSFGDGLRRVVKKFTTRKWFIGEYNYACLFTPNLPLMKSRQQSAPFFGLDDRMPVVLALILGLQHALAMLARSGKSMFEGRKKIKNKKKEKKKKKKKNTCGPVHDNAHAGYCSCIFLVVMGILSKFAAALVTIPSAVLGGMTTFLFYECCRVWDADYCYDSVYEEESVYIDGGVVVGNGGDTFGDDDWVCGCGVYRDGLESGVEGRREEEEEKEEEEVEGVEESQGKDNEAEDQEAVVKGD
ncbi:hypothetical protein PAAG_03721 [Paracoccidioides lutzii Pb01]|uniref:Uncharacterized protein n=1 Tax=Paracoccidioides lutzii (strain ATCC MYA-826 / Pb01) TaxID=502779 RepID=C1GYX7_PARBA|nr:hypothetical protein PAAG_03721 [Paracoccidioides lutzii Pb01]EEH41800.2 hypothetical protein PAAG_03721 [Paracoccidioides lutzii Pb01]